MGHREWGELRVSSSRGWVRSYAAIVGKTMDESMCPHYSLLLRVERIVLLPANINDANPTSVLLQKTI
jgi:hypothetical protein